MLNYSNPYDVLSETISFENVQLMGEMITLKTLRGRYAYSRQGLDWLYVGLVKDLNRGNDSEHVFSDAYDFVQNAVCFLCEFIGKKLTDVYTIKNGQEITIKQATYSLVGRLIDRMRRHFDRSCNKEKFLEKTSPNEINKYFIGKTNQVDTKSSFEQFTLFYFETHRKNKVTPQTYKGDLGRLKKYILPTLGKMPLKQITPDKCLTLIQTLQNEGKDKTADEVYSLLSIIFKGAIAYGILQKSPLAIIQIQKHVRESGTALTKDEEKLLLTGLTEPEFQIATAIALYTGLRPNELSSAKIDGDFIIALNSKRKNGKVEYKRIPIINALRPYIANGIPALPTPQLIRRRISAVLPNHKLFFCIGDEFRGKRGLLWVHAFSLLFCEAKKRPNIMAENKCKSSSAFRRPAL